MKNNKNIFVEGDGSDRTPSSSDPINKLSDNPIVKEIKSYFKKDLKDVELVNVIGNGDIYTIDLRFDIKDAAQHAQYAREQGKQRAYDIKRIIEIGIMKSFHIPSFSIQGVRVVKGLNKTYCEFAISFIYANTGNLKPTNESIQRDLRVRSLVESTIKKVNEDSQMPIKEKEDDLAEALKTKKKLPEEEIDEEKEY